MTLQNGQRPVGTITIRLRPIGAEQYHVEVSQEHVQGSWDTVYAVALQVLSVCLNQRYPDQQPGGAPVFQAMLTVLHQFQWGLREAHRLPLIERATEMPRPPRE